MAKQCTKLRSVPGSKRPAGSGLFSLRSMRLAGGARAGGSWRRAGGSWWGCESFQREVLEHVAEFLAGGSLGLGVLVL
jgi:hypothetical protein